MIALEITSIEHSRCDSREYMVAAMVLELTQSDIVQQNNTDFGWYYNRTVWQTFLHAIKTESAIQNIRWYILFKGLT